MLNNYFQNAPNIIGLHYTVYNNELYVLGYFDDKGMSVSLAELYNHFKPYAQIPFSVMYVYHQTGIYLPVILNNDGYNSPSFYLNLQFVPVPHDSADVWTNAKVVSDMVTGYNLVHTANTVTYDAISQIYFELYNSLIQSYVQAMGAQIAGVQAAGTKVEVIKNAPKSELSISPDASNSKKNNKNSSKKSNKNVPNETSAVSEKVEEKINSAPDDTSMSNTPASTSITEQQLHDRNEQLRNRARAFTFYIKSDKMQV